VNRAVFALGILASANTHFQTTVVYTHLRVASPPADWAGFHPSIALWAGVALVAAAWAALVPYAIYAFRMLSPEVLIERLEGALRRDLARAGLRGRALPWRRTTARRRRARVRERISDLANVALRAMERGDRDLSLDGVRALERTYASYLDRKATLPPVWFEPEREWFAGLSDEAFRLVCDSRTWVGHLLLQEIQLTYAAALTRAPDAAGEIATVALGLVGQAVRLGDEELVALGIRFANTMLREAVKRGDASVVQDVARVHRDLLEQVAEAGQPRAGGRDGAADRIAEAAGHLAYYCAFARTLGAHEKADVLVLSLARLAELVTARLPRALLGVLEAIERVEEPPAGAGGEALVKARALVASCLVDAGRRAEADRALGALARARPADRERVRAALEATTTRAEAGREAFGAEPGLEFIPEPRRSRMLAVLAAR
jgi:hypothetical protein